MKKDVNTLKVNVHCLNRNIVETFKWLIIQATLKKYRKACTVN